VPNRTLLQVWRGRGAKQNTTTSVERERCQTEHYYKCGEGEVPNRTLLQVWRGRGVKQNTTTSMERERCQTEHYYKYGEGEVPNRTLLQVLLTYNVAADQENIVM
jgi:hypothetical protein